MSIVSFCKCSCVNTTEDGLSTGRNMKHSCEGNFINKRVLLDLRNVRRLLVNKTEWLP